MKRTLTSFLLVLLSFMGAWTTGSAFAEENWMRWRGPNENGAVLEGAPPTEWSLEKNLRWKVEIPGKGSSTPIVVGNQVIVLTAVETDRKKEGAEPAPANNDSGGGGRRRRPAPTNFVEFKVVSFDRANGAKLWETKVTEEVPHEAGHQTNTLASSSPITNGERIYADFGSRGIYCLDMKGKVLWSKALGKMQTVAGFGEGSSPTLTGDKLIVPWDHEAGSFLVALNANSGEEIWKTPRDEKTCWATPLVVSRGGRDQVITNGRRVRSYDLATGKLLWECGGQVSNPVPSPILFGEHVICMTGYQGNAVQSIRLDSEGDVTDSDKVLWSNNDAAPYVPSATLYGGLIYLNKGNNGIVSCLDAKTGKIVVSQKRVQGLGTLYASPVAAAGHVYFTGRDGVTVVVKHNSDLEVVATNPLGETIDGSLAIVGDTIFARGEKHLFCIAKP